MKSTSTYTSNIDHVFGSVLQLEIEFVTTDVLVIKESLHSFPVCRAAFLLTIAWTYTQGYELNKVEDDLNRARHW